jgi:RNA polymerase sigma-70 factor (ECF subfamily)
MSKLNYHSLIKATHLEGIITPDVIKSCIAGRRTSQELLYQYFAPRMFGICLRYAHDYPTAEDLLQEGFVKVFNKLEKHRIFTD